MKKGLGLQKIFFIEKMIIYHIYDNLYDLKEKRNLFVQ